MRRNFPCVCRACCFCFLNPVGSESDVSKGFCQVCLEFLFPKTAFLNLLFRCSLWRVAVQFDGKIFKTQQFALYCGEVKTGKLYKSSLDGCFSIIFFRISRCSWKPYEDVTYKSFLRFLVSEMFFQTQETVIDTIRELHSLHCSVVTSTFLIVHAWSKAPGSFSMMTASDSHAHFVVCRFFSPVLKGLYQDF